jgi:hypothetical protein
VARAPERVQTQVCAPGLHPPSVSIDAPQKRPARGLDEGAGYPSSRGARGAAVGPPLPILT